MQETTYQFVTIGQEGSPKIRRAEHLVIAETALGKPLPRKSIVHHINGDKADNHNTNLVICENQTYHALLHARARALKLSGNANFKQCRRCQEWSAPTELIFQQGRAQGIHQNCPPKVAQIKPLGLFVTVAEVARAFRYTPKAVRSMMERGDLPGRKFGGEWRMHRDDFARLTRPQLENCI